MSKSDKPHPWLARLRLCVGFLLLTFQTAPIGICAEPRLPPVLEPGAIVRLTRDETLHFLNTDYRTGKVGEVFKVLDFRPATKQVFIAVEREGQLIAVWVPADSVELKAKSSTPIEIKKADALFAGQIPVINIRIPDKGLEKLRKDPRSYVEATIEESDGTAARHIGLKLKGSVGSFKPVDERPGFSINTDKFNGGERFHGLKRFQLNNCNQDDSALNELIAGEIARKAGVPASRCTHALVSLNGKPLGTYVLKEAFHEELIGTFFTRVDGHLYDGGFCADIRKEMDLDRGDEENQERFTELLAALADTDPARQLERLEKVVDVGAYLRHLALENILCHWDGYSFNRNNYRIYENMETGRFHFFLHGMDQTFREARWNLWKSPAGAVGAILWRKEQHRARYDVILKDVYEKVIQPLDWPARIEQVGARLKDAIAAGNPDRAKEYAPRVIAARDQIRDRVKDIQRQINAGNPMQMMDFKGTKELSTQTWTPQTDNAKADEGVFENRQCLHLVATGDANASWRLPVMLPKGSYRFEAELRTKGVVKLSDPSGEGAGLRISGASRQRKNALQGDAAWIKISWEFDSLGSEHVLVAELRAKSGEMWIDRKTLRLVRIR